MECFDTADEVLTHFRSRSLMGLEAIEFQLSARLPEQEWDRLIKGLISRFLYLAQATEDEESGRLSYVFRA